MSDPVPDRWKPQVYERFREQRERPVHDLLALLRPSPGGSAADLGCGTGRYTPVLHRHVQAATTVGIDSSPAMLADADAHLVPGVSFREGDIADLDGEWDVLFANASIQWLPDPPGTMAGLVRRLREGGQLAVQVPANFDHPSHTVAAEVGAEFGVPAPERRVLDPGEYAEILVRAGIHDPEVVLRVYGHHMQRTDEVIEWVSGTLLTHYERVLDDDAFVAFLAEYRNRLLTRLRDPEGSRSYFYAFPRILIWGMVG